MLKDNFHWILLGLAIGFAFYLVDKYIFKFYAARNFYKAA